MQKVKVGINGHTGRTGHVLQQLLSQHPFVELVYTTSRSKGEEGDKKQVEVMFLALPPEESLKEAPILLKQNKKVIDLSKAYRLDTTAIYGLPEENKDKLRNAKLVANPGCYATSVILGLLPIVEFITKIDVVAYSGISGAGKYPIKEGGIKKYLEGRQHPHIPEIEMNLCAFVSSFNPHIVEFSDRGIIAKIKSILDCQLSYENILNKYKEYYNASLFVKIENEFKDINFESIKTLEDFDNAVKDIVYTNYCRIRINLFGNELTVVSRLDNLMKGAAGQAVQNLNLMCGFGEETGLI
jgi:N-acetyl-gamma-glutamyl-phosphate reductase